MQSFLTGLDRMLRARPEDCFRLAADADARPRWRPHLTSVWLLGGLYGVAMGLFALLARGATGDGWLQLAATIVKVPLLFLATLAVTLPSLYVVSTLAGSALSLRATTTLLLASNAVALALLASLAPVAAFFTLSTRSYPFITLLHVLFFGVTGLVGMSHLRRALDAAFPTPARPRPEPPPPPGEPTTELAPHLAPRSPRPKPPARRVFELWTFIFGIVGAQMAWVMRPFIGDPYQPFSLFRERDSNVFVALLTALGRLLGG